MGPVHRVINWYQAGFSKKEVKITEKGQRYNIYMKSMIYLLEIKCPVTEIARKITQTATLSERFMG